MGNQNNPLTVRINVRTFTPMRETKSDRIEVRIYPALKADGKKVADAKGKSLSDWIVNLIQNAIKKAKPHG